MAFSEHKFSLQMTIDIMADSGCLLFMETMPTFTISLLLKYLLTA